MTSNDALEAFAKQHSFNADLPVEERDGIACAVDCHDAINRGYASLPNAVLDRDVAVGLIWQLYERCTERVFGALTAMATSCAASSEVVTRSAIEATITTRYILRDRHARLASFFQDHVDRASKQEKQWRDAASNAEEPERATHLAACEYRRAGIAAMKRQVESLKAHLIPSGELPRWPDTKGKFDALGQALTYRTFYARLCAEPHFDAEETLRYFIGRVAGSEIFEQMAIETIMFSRFLLAEAVRGYAETGREFAERYGMSVAAASCLAAESVMQAHVLRLSEQIGAEPPRSGT